MTPPADWHPLPETVDYIARWYAWATNGAPEKARWFWQRTPMFRRDFGLCARASNRVRLDLLEGFGYTSTPFGSKEYWERADAQTQHLDPNRLAFCRAVLVRAGRLGER